MPINPKAVGSTGNPTRRSWTSKDALLYAVGVGAGTSELPFTTENTKDVAQRVLPTFAVIIATGGMPMDKIGSFNPFLMVHGTQGIELLGEIPPDGEIETVGKVVGIWDKGNAAVLEFEATSTNVATGKPLLRTRSSLFCRGEGGWGGDRGPSEKLTFPSRKADHQITYQTREDQALTYRLSGDRNPLHSDPSFAKAGGFERADSAWSVHVWIHRARAAACDMQRRSVAFQVDGRAFFEAGTAGRRADDLDVGRRQDVSVPDGQPEGRSRARSGSYGVRLSRRAASLHCSLWGMRRLAARMLERMPGPYQRRLAEPPPDQLKRHRQAARR